MHGSIRKAIAFAVLSTGFEDILQMSVFRSVEIVIPRKEWIFAIFLRGCLKLCLFLRDLDLAYCLLGEAEGFERWEVIVY